MPLRELYQEMIIDHGKQPRNFGTLSGATHQHQGHNPLCGDQLTLYLKIDEQCIHEAHFIGEGCAISVASASLMTEAIKGKSLVEVQQLFTDFHQLVTQGQGDSERLGKLTILAGVIEFPMRVKCATLAWHTLKAALEHDSHVVSTE